MKRWMILVVVLFVLGAVVFVFVRQQFGLCGKLEVISNLEGVEVKKNCVELNKLLKDYKVFKKGVFVRDTKEKNLTIDKKRVEGIKIFLTNEEYERDKVISNGVVLSSSREEINGDELIINLGFSKDYLSSLDINKKELYITQSFVMNLYNISHVNSDFYNKTQMVKGEVAKYLKSGVRLFLIKL